jgi:hypothetical protein
MELRVLVEKVSVENIHVSKRRKLYSFVIFQVGRIAVIQKRKNEAKFGHATGVGVTVHAKEVLLKKFAQLDWSWSIPVWWVLLLDQSPIALDEKSA